jgi:hypothetical protein
MGCTDGGGGVDARGLPLGRFGLHSRMPLDSTVVGLKLTYVPFNSMSLGCPLTDSCYHASCRNTDGQCP